MTLFAVRVDDPDMEQEYHFEIEAGSPQEACTKGARRACEEDGSTQRTLREAGESLTDALVETVRDCYTTAQHVLRD